ncbi:hypothetical protein SLEP1_g57578 [Rubroshorea leprosula]|uniref:Uncharacterized protein n=1 Tax=Rubroshorea leprosula TaxID=152421 RepID=A0AAV5MN18_9ROSI|nr:hypothetical protein SLEP1_g57578 [Rubroshorea leprosula]
MACSVDALGRSHVRQCLELVRPHVCQRLDPGCRCVHPCLEQGHSRAPMDVAPDCSCTLPRVLSVTLRHGPGIDASAGKAHCILSVPPCAYSLVCISVVIATPCHDTNTRISHARIHACACARGRAHACPRVRACTPRCCTACPLDAAHTSYVPMAAAPCHDAHDFDPQPRVP